MKKLFLLFLIFGILLSINLVDAKQCSTLPNGYLRCFEHSNTYGDATAYVKIYMTNLKGIYKSGYYIKEIYVNVGFVGDKLYYLKNTPVDRFWDVISCNEYRCSSSYIVKEVSSGKQVLATPGQTLNFCPAWLVWDETQTTDYWSWAGQASGWWQGCRLNYNVVECYDDNDCDTDQICDKTGDWTTWSCKAGPCKDIICEDKCQDSIRYYNGYCFNGECIYQTESCEFGCSNGECIIETEETFYRFQDNTCITVNILSSEKIIDDYSTLQECEENIIIECVEDWSCTDWGDCIEEEQIRVCIDLNECGTEIDKPVEIQICEEIEITTYEIIDEQCIKTIDGRYKGLEECEKYLENPFYRFLKAIIEWFRNIFKY